MHRRILTNEHRVYDDYSMILSWDPRDAIYVVTVPELPGCMTHGRTQEEAVEQGRDAIASWIESARQDGESVPEPRLFAQTAG